MQSRAILTLLVPLILAGCGGANRRLAENAPLVSLTYTDNLGVSFKLMNPPQRVVSLAPNVTELIVALNATDKLVGMSDKVDVKLSKALAKIPTFETYPDTSVPFGQIGELKPDCIFASNEVFGRPDYIRKQFADAQIPVFFQSNKSLKDVYANIRQIGAMVDKAKLADDFAKRLEAFVKELGDSATRLGKREGMILLHFDPPMVVGSGHYLHEIASACGVINQFAHIKKDYVSVTGEAMRKLEPKYILMVTEDPQFLDKLVMANPVLNDMPLQLAFELKPEIYLRPGLRTLQAIRQLAKMIQPGLSVEQIYDKHFGDFPLPDYETQEAPKVENKIIIE